MPEFSTFLLPAPAGGSRYDHMVRRFTRDAQAIDSLINRGVEPPEVGSAVRYLADTHDVMVPEVTFHGRRGAHTGYCMAPRPVIVARTGEGPVQQWEREKSRQWPDTGMIRLGNPTSLATVAHELGHHLVNVLHPPKTPVHGKVWVARFDEAAATIGDLFGVDS